MNFGMVDIVGIVDLIFKMAILRGDCMVNQPVNVYGATDYYENGMLECTFDGFGYRDNDGSITWYEGYNPPKDDDFYYTLIVPYGNGCDLSELIK